MPCVGVLVAVGGTYDPLAYLHGVLVRQCRPQGGSQPGNQRCGEARAVAIDNLAVGIYQRSAHSYGAHVRFDSVVGTWSVAGERTYLSLHVHSAYRQYGVGVSRHGYPLPRLVAIVSCSHTYEHTFACCYVCCAAGAGGLAVECVVGERPLVVVEHRVAERNGEDVRAERVGFLQCGYEVIHLFGRLGLRFFGAHEIVVGSRGSTGVLFGLAGYGTQTHCAVHAGVAVHIRDVVGEVEVSELLRLSEAAEGVGVGEPAVAHGDEYALPVVAQLVQRLEVVQRELCIGGQLVRRMVR